MGKDPSYHKKFFCVYKNLRVIKNNQGFTLIEFLLYVGLVGTLLTVAGAIGLNVLFGKAKLSSIEEVSQNARFTMEKISDRIRNAEAINSPAVGVSASTLSLQMANAALNPTVLDVSSGTARVQEGAGTAVALTSDEVTVDTLQFTNVSYANTPGTIRIQMTLKRVNPQNRQEYNFEQTFYTTVNIRKK